MTAILESEGLPYAVIGAFALIKSADLPEGVADELHPWVRPKFLELWQLARIADPF